MRIFLYFPSRSVALDLEEGTVDGCVGKENNCPCGFVAVAFLRFSLNIVDILLNDLCQTSVRTALAACPRHIYKHGIGAVALLAGVVGIVAVT